MSVINQMLKELDQRKTEKKVVPEMVIPMAQYSTGKTFDLLKGASFIILMVTVISLGYWWQNGEMQTEPAIAMLKKTKTADTQLEKVNLDQQLITKAQPSAAAKKQLLPKDLKSSPSMSRDEIALMANMVGELKPAVNLPIETKQSSLQRVIKSKPQIDLKTQTARLFKSARSEIDAGRLSAAHQLLKDALVINPAFHKARVLMLSLLLQQQQTEALEQQLATSLQQWPNIHEYREIQARFLLQKGMKDEALEILQHDVPSVKKAPDFHALLAYVAQLLSKDPLAVKHYQLLLQQQPGRADWWLGLAVSEERQGNKSVALHAYQQSVGRPGLDPGIRDYARQRIKVLQGF